MVKSTTSKQKTLSREILVEELTAFEKRLDSRFDSKIDSVEERLEAKMDYTAQSFKEYVDSRIAPLRGDMQKQGDKMDRYFNGIVKMVEGLTERDSRTQGRLNDHERRLKIVEARS